MLTDLRAAMKARDGAAALHAALSAWRQNRAPGLADLIDAISAKVSGEPILDEREWTRVAVKKDPLDLGRLLPAIPHLPGRLLPAAGGTLAAFDDDPRFAIAVGAWCRDPPVTSKTLYAFWTAVIGAAVRTADVRVIPMFEARIRVPKGASVFWPRFYAALERALVRLRALPPTEPVDVARYARDVERLEIIEPVIEASVPTVEEAPLVGAARLLAGGDLVDAIEQMLIAWRAVRAPEIADAIDRATRMLPAYDRPLADSPGDVHVAWMAALREDPRGRVPQLVQHVNVGGTARAERRLLELAGLPDDPRVAMRLVELAANPDIPESRKQYWRSLYELVARIRDVRTCEPLRRELHDFAYAGGYNPHRHAKRYVADLVLAPPMAPRLDVATTQQLARVTDALATAERTHDDTERRLLDAIHEDRSSEGAHSVYADWLYEREHPRGALIALSMKVNQSAAERFRYEVLLDLPYVFGYLYDLSRHARIERGIPRHLHVNQFAGTLAWRRAASAPLMLLVESMQMRIGSVDYRTRLPSPADFAAFLMHSNTARLRTVENVPAALADAVATQIAARFEVETRDGWSVLRCRR